MSALEANQLFVQAWKAALEMVRKERLGGGTNSFGAGDVYRSPVVAGAPDELCATHNHFCTSFEAACLGLEG